MLSLRQKAESGTSRDDADKDRPVNKEIEERGLRAVNVETEIDAGFGAGIHYVTLVT